MRTPVLPSRRPGFLAQLPARPAVSSASFRGPRGSAVAYRAPMRSQAEDAYQDPEAQAAQQAAAYERATSEMVDRMASSVELLRATVDRLSSDARADALEVAFLVARRIIDAEITANTEPLVALVRSAIKRLGEARRVTVKLNPTDAEAINTILAAREPGAAEGFGIAQIDVLADTGLERGDCVVEGDVGSVDARLGTRIEELRRAIEDQVMGDGV